MLTVVFVASSSYSGSTLLSFLLNMHPEIFTVGEMDGWNYGENEDFRCSCGERLSTCPFFRLIGEAFRKDNLPFDPREFGTAYRLAENERCNRYLTAGLPALITSTPLERMRDALVFNIPYFRKKLERQDRANVTFIRTALSSSGASVFVDAAKSPYRLRHLRRIKDIDLHVLYLVRDLRGVVLSNLELKKPGWNAAVAARMWVHQQLTIMRVLREFPSVLRIRYEDLCDDVHESLARVHRFLKLSPHPFTGDFKGADHHILGNVMRLGENGKIVKNTRWERELLAEELDAILRVSADFVEKKKQHTLSGIIKDYLE